jgi:hypothetical protein
MFLNVIGITASGTYPLSVAAAQTYANAEGLDEALFTDLIVDACDLITLRTHHYLRPTIFRADAPSFARVYTFYAHPVNTITSIVYKDTNGANVTLDTAALTAAGSIQLIPSPHRGRIIFADSFIFPDISTEHVNPITFNFTGGYENNAPGHIKSLVRRIVTKLYEDRADPVSARDTASSLIMRDMILPL